MNVKRAVQLEVLMGFDEFVISLCLYVVQYTQRTSDRCQRTLYLRYVWKRNNNKFSIGRLAYFGTEAQRIIAFQLHYCMKGRGVRRSGRSFL